MLILAGWSHHSVGWASPFLTRFTLWLWLRWSMLGTKHSLSKFYSPFFSSSFFWSSSLAKNFFMASHGSLPAPTGKVRGGRFNSVDNVPCDRLTISFAKKSTDILGCCLIKSLTAFAIVEGVSSVSATSPSTRCIRNKIIKLLIAF